MHVHRFDTLIRCLNSLTRYHFDKAKKRSFELDISTIARPKIMLGVHYIQ